MKRRTLLTVLLLGAPALVGCRRALPDLGAAPAFELIDQAEQPRSRDSLRGRVWVATFMFTRCPTVCPQMMAAMRDVQQRATQRRLDLQLVTFSVDPEHDTPSVLTDFARRHGADLESWSFLTGDPERVHAVAKGFKVAFEGQADAGVDHFGILHGAHAVLVDRHLAIRGYYRIREAEERDRLLVDARSLR